ncbi:MAG: hypoxanthine phosphoribosyltransferase [Desulfobacteraceae bacterium]|nr:hypoxanthine phosphoribosyltransferase [Desulfobacteraceae bacterium]MBC2750203.1 hypoxanthine phosphoribosyltransferase [Desulfobacteraceae bacterium]
MSEFIPVLTKKEIDAQVSHIAQVISADYKDRELILIGILKGAFIFLSDLIRQLSIPVKVDFMCVSSYGDHTTSSGRIKLIKDVDININNKDVLIVEDIVDTGVTLSYLVDHLHASGASSVRICTLIDKRERRETDVRVDYACHTVDKGFLVGYGLDYAEFYRNLPEVYHLKL